MRNYMMIEKTKNGVILLSEGTGTEENIEYNPDEHWNEWETIKSEEDLFARIKELLKKQI